MPKKEHKDYYTLKMQPKEKRKFIWYVRQKMAKKGMTLSELAEEIHRPKQTVYNFFGGESKPLKFVAAEIANYFQINRSEWMWLTDEEMRNEETDKQ